MIAEDLEKARPEASRTLDKHEAIRHLIHSAIRLIVKMEDPFAVHLLAHSADKMLIDIAKKRGQELRVDWKDYIKPEYHKVFFKRNRETYNYFKHADTDFDDDLPIANIMQMNVMTLFITVANYVQLFGETTDHITLFNVFVMALMPEIIRPTARKGIELLKGLHDFENMTPAQCFEVFENNMGVTLPRYLSEAAKDREDIVEFYNLSFLELRAGKTKRDHVRRIPNYL